MHRRAGQIVFIVGLAASLRPLLAQELSQFARVKPEVAAAVGQARVLRNQSDYGGAQGLLDATLENCRRAEDRAGEVLVLNNLASIYRYRAGLTQITENQSPPPELVDKAVTLYEQVLPIARELGDKSNEAYARLYLGVLYTARKDDEKSLRYLSEALKLYKVIDDPEYIGFSYFYVGQTLLHRMRKPEPALESFEQALPEFRRAKQWRDANAVLREMSLAYQQLDANAKAANRPAANL
jgi:tetratricopeptide (TPR) repeat protein